MTTAHTYGMMPPSPPACIRPVRSRLYATRSRSAWRANSITLCLAMPSPTFVPHAPRINVMLTTMTTRRTIDASRAMSPSSTVME